MNEPTRTTDPKLNSILEDLVRREPIFHRSEFGTTRADFEHMTAPDFWEVGASGRRYSREYVLNELEKRYQNPSDNLEEDLQAEDFRCQELAPNLYLLTYTLTQQRTRRTHRSTIWQKLTEGWKIVFHQGTIIQAVE
jgi:hypothetical protein